MFKVMIIDISRCNGCYNCQIACKDEHMGTASSVAIIAMARKRRVSTPEVS